MLHRLFQDKAHSNHGESIWLTIYADMITNLVLLFLALYGLTMMGQESLIKAVQSMKFNQLQRTTVLFKPTDFSTVPDKLRAVLKGDGGVSIREEAGAIRIEFGEGILFASGQSRTKLSADVVLLKLAAVLNQLPFTVIVEGHTDDIPVSKWGPYKNNRELSLARSMSIVNWLIAKGKIEPAHLAAASYGEFKPRASNATETSRRMNRRVEIVLLKDFPYQKIVQP